jgi:hypothetical protein
MHPDLTHYTANVRDDSDAQLECYFDDYTLWHVYVNGAEIYNLLSEDLILELEREYLHYDREQAAQHNLDLAIARSEEI